MKQHFSKNIQEQIQRELFKASSSIKVAVAWFTNDLLFQLLKSKLKSGVKVSILINKDEINFDNNRIDFKEFIRNGGELYWNSTKNLMHDKFCIIDNRVVITGSFNWTNQASYNDESVTIFSDEDDTTDFFRCQFNNLIEKYDLIYIKDDVLVASVVHGFCGFPSIKKDEYEDEDLDYFDQDEYLEWLSERNRRIDASVKYYLDNDQTLHIYGEGVIDINTPSYLYGRDSYTRDTLLWRHRLPEENSFDYFCIRTIIVGEGIISIGESSFECCDTLKEVYLPNSLVSIEHDAFMGCRNLYHCDIPKGCVSIGHDAFRSCSNLVISSLPPMDYIGNRAFEEVEIVNRIYLSQNCEDLGEQAFYGAKGLREIWICNGCKLEDSTGKFYWRFDENVPDDVKVYIANGTTQQFSTVFRKRQLIEYQP